MYVERKENQEEANMFKHILLPTDARVIRSGDTSGNSFRQEHGRESDGLCVMPCITSFSTRRRSDGGDEPVSQTIEELAEATWRQLKRELK